MTPVTLWALISGFGWHMLWIIPLAGFVLGALLWLFINSPLTEPKPMKIQYKKPAGVKAPPSSDTELDKAYREAFTRTIENQKHEEVCRELEAEWKEIVDDPKSHCRKCGAVVLADSYGFLEFEDKSYICSGCLGRRSGVFLNLLNDIEYECPIRNYNPKKEHLGKRACNVLVRSPFM